MMNTSDDRWHQTDRLFTDALDLPPEERTAFLKEACDDEAIRQRVEDLLQMAVEADDMLEEPLDADAEGFWSDFASYLEERAPHLSPPQRIGPYTIERKLGVGGMGVVYRARHRRLGRPAALKFLPPHRSADETAKQRLVTEARAASALDHPNICTIYDIGETEAGQLFIAMAYYAGETLRNKIDGGPLSAETALDYARQLADGLARAHEAGIIHRDVKPANLMITDEDVLKILDFGIAKMRDVSSTAAGMTPGTISYMSPEQVQGEAVDHRSDIWSLGVVLYEMLTGKRPFRGEHEQAIIYSILHEDPEPLDMALPPTFHGLRGLVEACLQKDPELRPSSMNEVIERLPTPGDTAARHVQKRGPIVGYLPASLRPGRRTAFAGLTVLLVLLGLGAYAYLGSENLPPADEANIIAERSIAVLPFANLGGQEDDAYFADGVTDDILTHLALVPDFTITSRTTSMLYKGSEEPVASIAGALGVRYVLEGSVRRDGDRVRIASQLIDGQTDQHVWAESFDRRLEDVFSVQTEIASAIAEALETELSSSVAERIERRPTDDLEAYDFFLRGREDFHREDREGMEHAMASFRAALERDPDFALARAWLALSHAVFAYNHGGGAAWSDSAVTTSRIALEQQPDLPEARQALGVGLIGLGRYDEAEEALRRTLALAPGDGRVHNGLGLVYSHRGQWDEAIRFTRISFERNPARAHVFYGNLGFYYLQLGMYDRAAEMLDRSLSLHWNPSTLAVRGWTDFVRGEHEAALAAAERLAREGDTARTVFEAGELYFFGEEFEHAREALARAYELSPVVSKHGALVGVLYGYVLDRAGEAERAAQMFAEAERYALKRIEGGSQSRNFYYSLACLHALRGETSEAFHWLEEATQVGWTNTFFVRHDPLLKNIRDEPQFEALLDQMSERLSSQRERLEQAEI